MTSGWTEEREARLRELWLQRTAASAIAKELGCTRNAVLGKINRLGLAAQGGAPNVGAWTQERIDKLLEMHSAGKSYRTIATELGICRSAVCAKLQRMNAPKRIRLKAKPKEGAKMQTLPFIPDAPLVPGALLENSRNLMLEELEPRDCRFPTTQHDVLEHRFCGQRKLFGLPYCGFHCAAAFNPNPYRTKARAW